MAECHCGQANCEHCAPALTQQMAVAQPKRRWLVFPLKDDRDLLVSVTETHYLIGYGEAVGVTPEERIAYYQGRINLIRKVTAT